MSRPITLVTGGGRGIGAACARLAAEAGHDVAISYVSDRSAAEALVSELAALGVRAHALKADVAREDEVAALFDAIDGALGPLTYLVNNAGVTGASSRLDSADPAVIRACIDVNVTGAILVAQAAAQRMATRHGGAGGAIVNISSVASRIGSPGEYVWYAASKGAIDAFTLGLAKELALDGVRVNAVAPGMIDTEIHEKSTRDGGRVERIRPLIPMQRIGTPEEVARTVMFLLSDAASYITGAVVDVSGGR